MKVLVIGGFLGSGKTTLALQLARRLTGQSARVVVIENEAGEIGIDNRYLTMEGLQVQELHGGCICCTLKHSLKKTLTDVALTLRPDWIIVEPSGIADPVDVMTAVHDALPNGASASLLVIVDATRFEMLESMMEPMLISQSAAADVLVINKTDEVDAERVRLIVRRLSSLSPGSQLHPMSAHCPRDVGLLLQQVI
jgi:G3E family GTPase